jgi:hypothetical protein
MSTISSTTTTTTNELRMRLSAALSEIGQLRLQLETHEKQAKQHKEVRSTSPVQFVENDVKQISTLSSDRKLRMLAYEAGQLRSEVTQAESTNATLRNDITKVSAVSSALSRRAYRFSRKIDRIAKDANEHSSALTEVLSALGASRMSGVSRFLAECRAVGRRLQSAVEAYRLDKGDKLLNSKEGEEEEMEDEEEEEEYSNDLNTIEHIAKSSTTSAVRTKSSLRSVTGVISTPPQSRIRRQNVVSFAATTAPSTGTTRARASDSRISSPSGSFPQKQPPATQTQYNPNIKERDLFAISARSAIAELAAENASLNSQLSAQMERQTRLEAMLSDARAAHSLKLDIDNAMQSMKGSLVTAQRAAEENKAFAERMQQEKEALQSFNAELRANLNEARELIRNLQIDLVNRDREVAELDAAANAAVRTARNTAPHVTNKVNNMLDLDAPSFHRSSVSSSSLNQTTHISSKVLNEQTTSPKRAGDEQLEPKRLSASLSPTLHVKKAAQSSTSFGGTSMKQTLVSPSQPAHQTTSVKVPSHGASQHPQRILKRTLSSSSSSSSSIRPAVVPVPIPSRMLQQPTRASPVAGGRGGLQGYVPVLTSPTLTSVPNYERTSTRHPFESTRQHFETQEAPPSDSENSSPTDSTSSTLSRDIGELIGKGAHLRTSPNQKEQQPKINQDAASASASASKSTMTSQVNHHDKSDKSDSHLNSITHQAFVPTVTMSANSTLASVLSQEVSEAVISLAEQLHAMSISTPPPPQRSAAKAKEKIGRGGVANVNVASPLPTLVSPPPLAALHTLNKTSDSTKGNVDLQALAEIRAGLSAVDQEIASMRAKVSAATSAAASAASKARNSNIANVAAQRTRRDSSGLNISVGSTSTTSLDVPDLTSRARDKIWIKLEEGKSANSPSSPDSLGKVRRR